MVKRSHSPTYGTAETYFLPSCKSPLYKCLFRKENEDDETIDPPPLVCGRSHTGPDSRWHFLLKWVNACFSNLLICFIIIWMYYFIAHFTYVLFNNMDGHINWSKVAFQKKCCFFFLNFFRNFFWIHQIFRIFFWIHLNFIKES